MRSRGSFKEVWIRLVENEPAFVCTTQYGGLLRRSEQFQLAVASEAVNDVEDEFSAVLRTRRHLGRETQDNG